MNRLRTFRVGDHPAAMVTALVIVLGVGALYDVARLAQPTATTVVLAVEPPVIGPPLTWEGPTTTTQPSTTQPSISPPPTEPNVTTTQPDPPPVTTTTAAGVTVSAEAELVVAAAADMFRASEGLPPLTVDAGLHAYARDWAAHMAATGDLTHSNINDLLDNWGAVGENIGEGSSALAIFQTLISSPGHLEIILGSAYAFDGVGVAVDGSGRLWLCHVLAGIDAPITTTTLPLGITVPTLPLP